MIFLKSPLFWMLIKYLETDKEHLLQYCLLFTIPDVFSSHSVPFKLLSWSSTTKYYMCSLLYILVSTSLLLFSLSLSFSYSYRLSSLYNELLTLGAQDDMGVATFCHNTCPILQHPLRKLSITKILQVQYCFLNLELDGDSLVFITELRPRYGIIWKWKMREGWDI
jgi:hypothetical protein